VSELLPCPFCGSDDVFMSQAVQGSCWVVCEAVSCGAIGPTKPTPTEAAAAWNRRTLIRTGEASVVRPTDMPPSIAPPEAVRPVEMESRLIGDIAAFRASDVELMEAFDFTRPCLGRARERITGDLILVQVSGGLQGGFAWAYAKPRATPADAARTRDGQTMAIASNPRNQPLSLGLQSS
jgi:Lar family restriction alleviation protein